MTAVLEIENLKVAVEGKEVVHGISLTIEPGEVHAIMGRNGSGKTTLSNAIMGHPRYEITAGSIRLLGEDITKMPAHERARRRLFLAFQHPVGIPGVNVGNFLRTSLLAVRGGEVDPKQARKLIREEAKAIGVDESFLKRSLNDGFSGGEKKRMEALQMRLLQPRAMILDETDSGLDIDSLKSVSESIESLRSPERGILLITHYQRMLNYIKPDQVHVLLNGLIVKSGCAKLAEELEERGYEWISEATAK
jgi:Fe-S cluster assembly ATP-binding protein